KTKDGETWAAVNKSPVKKGAEVTIENASVMQNFESKSLKKTFDTIIFGNLAGDTGAAGDVAHIHRGLPQAAQMGEIKVAKAQGANARTIAEITGKQAELKDKPVLVRGKVVKATMSVMNKNWIHLRDGTGSAS